MKLANLNSAVAAYVSWGQALMALKDMVVTARPGQLCQDDADTFRRMANAVEAKLKEGSPANA